MVKRAFLSAGLAVLCLSFAKAQEISVPAGVTIHCRLSQTITTQSNAQGDPFSARVSEPLMIDGREAIPVGATIQGRISALVRPGHFRGVGEMLLTAETITFPDGRSLPLYAVLVTTYGSEGAKVSGDEGVIEGPSSKFKTLEEVSAGAGAGGALGTLIGGLHGTVVGGVIGGVAGLADTLRRRGQDLTLPTGTQLNYQLSRALELGGPTPVARAEAQPSVTRPAQPAVNLQPLPPIKPQAQPSVRESDLKK